MIKEKQVEKSHYEFSKYMTKARWASVWHQLDEVIKSQPENVLEIGPGSGVFKQTASAFGVRVETVDIDPELKPDYVGTADDIPLRDNTFDVVCAFQVLEHMEFETSLKALAEMARVSRKRVIISLPDVTTSWASTITIPKMGVKRIVIPRIAYKPPEHKFDGEHYWEVGKSKYILENIISEFSSISDLKLLLTYRVHENQYHRFFIFEKLLSSTCQN